MSWMLYTHLYGSKHPYHSAVLHFFKPTFMWFMVGAGVIGRPFLSFLDGTPHKQAW